MRGSNGDLEREVADLGDLPRNGLAALWKKAHGHSPPRGIRQELLLRSATWHLQAKRLGGVRPNTCRLLKTAMADAAKLLAAKASIVSLRHSAKVSESQTVDGIARSARDAGVAPQPVKPLRSTLSPGARLVREWNGKTHVVDVIQEGFVFQAKVHKSLTAIAHQITGAHWSGPRFFGL